VITDKLVLRVTCASYIRLCML